MHYLYWREESQTMETTLLFAMQQVWNMRADLDADFLFVCPGLSTEAYCSVAVRDALLNIQERRERYLYVTHVSSDILWPQQHFYRRRGWLTMSWAQREHWLDVEWSHMLRLELLGDGAEPGHSQPMRRNWQWLVMHKCLRWHRRVKTARSARHLHALKQIPAVLERAALGLFARLHQNRDVLGNVLQLAAAAICSEHGLDLRTRLPLAHM